MRTPTNPLHPDHPDNNGRTPKAATTLTGSHPELKAQGYRRAIHVRLLPSSDLAAQERKDAYEARIGRPVSWSVFFSKLALAEA